MTSTIPPAIRGILQLLEELEAELPPPAERRRIREAAGLSQRRLSLALGVCERNVCNWEKEKADGGNNPTRDNRLRYRLMLDQLRERAEAKQVAAASTEQAQK